MDRSKKTGLEERDLNEYCLKEEEKWVVCCSAWGKKRAERRDPIVDVFYKKYFNSCDSVSTNQIAIMFYS